jgi:hypothetical protein
MPNRSMKYADGVYTSQLPEVTITGSKPEAGNVQDYYRDMIMESLKSSMLQSVLGNPFSAANDMQEYFSRGREKQKDPYMSFSIDGLLSSVAQKAAGYNTGGPIANPIPNNLSNQEYTDLYNQGRVHTYDANTDTYNAGVLPEVEITGSAPKSWKDFAKRYSTKISDDHKGSLAGSLFAAPVMAALGAPQAAATYWGSKNKDLEPSKAMDIQNPYGAFAADMLIDPTILAGPARAGVKGLGAIGKGVGKKLNAINAVRKQQGTLPLSMKNVRSFYGDAYIGVEDAAGNMNYSAKQIDDFHKKVGGYADDVDKAIRKRIKDLKSPEGFRRLVEQEKEHLVRQGEMPEIIDDQAVFNAKVRIQEIENIKNENRLVKEFDESPDNMPGTKSHFFLDRYLRDNATYSLTATNSQFEDFSRALRPAIGVGGKYVGSRPTIMHEIAHAIQRGRTFNADRQIAYNITPRKNLKGINAEDYNYAFRSPSEGTAFASELREAMLQAKLIPDYYTEITPQILKKASKYFKKNPIGIFDANTDVDKVIRQPMFNTHARILNYMEPSDNNYKVLSDVLNKLPATIPVIGAGVGANQAASNTPEYNTGGPIANQIPNDLTNQQYADLYNEGRVHTYDPDTDTYNAATLPEVEITAPAPKSWKDFASRYNKKISDQYKGSLAGSLFVAPVDAALGASQAAASYWSSKDDNKSLLPAEVMGVENPYASFLINAVADPNIVFGLGNAGLKVASRLGKYAVTQGPLKNVSKINPWKFKPREGYMYRGIGEEGYVDAIESRVFRPKQHRYAEGRSLAEKITTPKQFGSTFYAPAENFGVVENYGPNYLAEVPFEGNQFVRRYGRKDWSWSTPRQIPIEEGRILKKDWLKGYKEIPDNKALMQNQNINAGRFDHDATINKDLVWKDRGDGKTIPFNKKTNKSLQEEYIDDLKEYYDSPEFSRIMREEYPDVDIKKYKQSTLENLEKQITYNIEKQVPNSGGVYYRKNSNDAIFISKPNFRQRVNVANQNKNIPEGEGQSYLKNMSATDHELSHQRTNSNELLPDYLTRDYLWSNTKQSIKDSPMDQISGEFGHYNYYANPTEFEVRLRQLKKDLKREGIVDYFNTPVEKHHIQTLLDRRSSLNDEYADLMKQQHKLQKYNPKTKKYELSDANREKYFELQDRLVDMFLGKGISKANISSDSEDLLQRWDIKFLSEQAKRIPALIPYIGVGAAGAAASQLPSKEAAEYNTGGPIEPVKSFYNNYLNSPKYLERLTLMGHTNPRGVISDRKELLNTVGVTTDPTQSTSYRPSKHSINLGMHGSDDVTAAHEMSHVVGALGNRGDSRLSIHPSRQLNPNEREALASRNLGLDQHYRDNNAQEMKADLDAFRYMLSKDKLYDTGTQEFSKDILNKAKSRYKNNEVINRLFKNVKSDDSLIWLMNSIAANSNNAQVTTAQHGGKLKNYKYGGKITDSSEIAKLINKRKFR